MVPENGVTTLWSYFNRLVSAVTCKGSAKAEKEKRHHGKPWRVLLSWPSLLMEWLMYLHFSFSEAKAWELLGRRNPSTTDEWGCNSKKMCGVMKSWCSTPCENACLAPMLKSQSFWLWVCKTHRQPQRSQIPWKPARHHHSCPTWLH